MRRAVLVAAGVLTVAGVAGVVWSMSDDGAASGAGSGVAGGESVAGGGDVSKLVCAGRACVLPDGQLASLRTDGVVDLVAAGVPGGAQSVAVSPLAGQDASVLVRLEEGRLVDLRALPPGPYLLTVSTGTGVYQFAVDVGPSAPSTT
jgi:hypothetical protein